MKFQALQEEIFRLSGEEDFNRNALEVFRFQSSELPVYRDFLRFLGKSNSVVSHYSEIPFLPIAFFKTHRILASGQTPRLEFGSSGTTGAETSRHFVADPSLYERSFTEGFRLFYGDPEQWCIAAILPSYLERKNSSLIYMTEKLIRRSKDPNSGFYSTPNEHFAEMIRQKSSSGSPCIVIGVSFALEDFAEQFPGNYRNIIFMETGGMKGRRKEKVRAELHEKLCKAFSVTKIHSEYGMTELLSQAYSNGDGIFRPVPWMKVLTRQTDDPLSLTKPGQTGGINIIDLANIFSCSFIATQDLGKVHPDGSFEILGRFDHSDIRGCNLLLG